MSEANVPLPDRNTRRLFGQGMAVGCILLATAITYVGDGDSSAMTNLVDWLFVSALGFGGLYMGGSIMDWRNSVRQINRETE